MSSNSKIASRVGANPPHENNRPGLRAPGWLANRPAIGWTLFVLGSLVFAGLTLNLFAAGPLLAWDQALATSLPAIGLSSPPYVKPLMNAGFYLGKEVIMAVDILLALWFIYKKYWQELSMVVIGWSGSALIFYTLSTLIGRARPSSMIWIIVAIPGFPSGHAVASVTFYGLMTYLLLPRMRTVFAKTVLIATALLLTLFIGFSRIFTGGHYLTDILAGYAVGMAWSGLAYTLIEIYFQNHLAQKSQNKVMDHSKRN